MVRSLNEYFSLWSEEAALGPKGQTRHRQIKLYLGVLLGALSKVVYDALVGANEGSFELASFLVAAIASIVVFPQFYYQGGLNKGKLTFAKWCFAFQNGFFWSVAMSALAGVS